MLSRNKTSSLNDHSSSKIIGQSQLRPTISDDEEVFLHSPLEITSEAIGSYPLSWRWWAMLTSPIILFSLTVAAYSYFQAEGTSEILTLNSVNILLLLFWGVITYRSLTSPFITLSRSELHIKDFLGGQNRILNWDDIEDIRYGTKRLQINTKHQDNIAISRRFLADQQYEDLFEQLRNEVKCKKSSIHKVGRYGVIMNGNDAYVTFDCFGTFSKITDLTSYLNSKKVNKSIGRIYICINGKRRRFLYRITEKNIAKAINDASQKAARA